MCENEETHKVKKIQQTEEVPLNKERQQQHQQEARK